MLTGLLFKHPLSISVASLDCLNWMIGYRLGEKLFTHLTICSYMCQSCVAMYVCILLFFSWIISYSDSELKHTLLPF